MADTETPRVVYVSKGQLEYQTSESGQWLPLQSYDNDREPLSTIHAIMLSQRCISFVQQTCGGAVSCSLRLDPMQYGSRIRIGMAEGGQSQQFDIIVELTREELCFTSCLRAANAGIKPNHTIQQCPLAQVCKSFSAMRLYLPRGNFGPKFKRSSAPNEFWVKIVNALRRDLDSVPQPSLDAAAATERSIDLSSSQKGNSPPSVPKVDITSVRERFNNLPSSQKKSTPPKKTSASVQQAVAISEPQRTQGQKAPAQHSKVQTSSPAAKSVQKPSEQKPPRTPQRQVISPNTEQIWSGAAKSAQKPPAIPQKQPVPPIPKQTSSFVQPPPPKMKQTSAFVQPTPPKSKHTSSLPAKSVQKPPTTPQQQPIPSEPKQTAGFVQPIPPKAKQSSSAVQSTPAKSKQTSSSPAKSVQKPPTTAPKQPIPPIPKQTSTFVQPPPPKLKQASAFVQPTPPEPKQSSAIIQPTPPKSKQTSPFVQPIPPESKQNSSLIRPAPTQSKQSSSIVQPAPPKSKSTSEFAQSQNSLIPKTVNQKPTAKPPPPINPHPRKIIDYKDLDSVVAVPSGSIHLDYGNPTTPSQKGSAKKPERPKWEASIMQLQKLKEAAELEGDKAMAEKARKMIKLFEADAASPGTETKAQVDNFRTMWTLL